MVYNIKKGDFEMKRKILFAIFCIGIVFAGAIFHDDLARSNTTSLLSDLEMKQISGKCACYDDGYSIDCVWYGSLECKTSSGCPNAYRPSNEYLYEVTTDGSPNGLVPATSYVPCYTYYSLNDLGEFHPYE